MSRPKKIKTVPKLNLASEESKRVIAAFMAQPKPVQSPKTGPSSRLYNMSKV